MIHTNKTRDDLREEVRESGQCILANVFTLYDNRQTYKQSAMLYTDVGFYTEWNIKPPKWIIDATREALMVPDHIPNTAAQKKALSWRTMKATAPVKVEVTLNNDTRSVESVKYL